LIIGPCAGALQVDVATDAPEDRYEITAEVLVEKPCRFGVNVEPNAPLPWFPTRLANVWNTMSAMEPFEACHVHTFGPACTNEGARIVDVWNNPKETGKNFWHPGLGHWDTIPVGLFDGGNAVIYRKGDGYMEKLHEARIIRYSPQPKGEEFVELDPPLSGPIKEKDIIVVRRRYDAWPSQAGLTNEQIRARLEAMRYKQFAPEKNSGVSFDFDSTQHCPEAGSTASMKIALPGGRNKGVFQWFSFNADNHQIHPSGTTFKVQAWLRQEGMASGAVTFLFGNQQTSRVVAGPSWKKHELSFVFDPAKAPTNKGPDRLGIYSEEAGTLWVDNFAVWDASEPLGAIRKIHRDALKAAKPGSIRILTPLHRYSLEDSLFGEVFTARTMHGRNFDGASVHQLLELCKETGADPWISLYPLMSDAELDALAEYLFGPPDHGYGKRRAERGQAEPWSHVFGKIYLECANETWNTIFAPLAWPGKPDVYAAVANRMFKRIKQHPFARREQIVCIASGFGRDPTGWTRRVAEMAVEADAVDVAAYFGGSDGLSAKGSGGSDDETVARQIIRGQLVLSGPGIVGHPRRELRKMIEGLRGKTGRTVNLAAYEAGPGYILPGPGKVSRASDEIIGKSLGLAVVTLDTFLMENAMGYLAQNYYKYNVGHNWVTHNNERDMFPQASWIALTMRNKHCEGSLFKVVPGDRKLVSVPPQELEGWTYDGKPKNVNFKGQQNIPLTECYVYGEGKKRTVVLFNRSAEEPRPIVLKLPYEPRNEADLYYLTGNYLDGNAHEYKIKEQHRKVTDLKRNYTFTLPPSSIYMLVHEIR
jgi:hypothetical protein